MYEDTQNIVGICKDPEFRGHGVTSGGPVGGLFLHLREDATQLSGDQLLIDEAALV